MTNDEARDVLGRVQGLGFTASIDQAVEGHDFGYCVRVHQYRDRGGKIEQIDDRVLVDKTNAEQFLNDAGIGAGK